MDLTERGASALRHPWEIQRFEAYRTVLQEHGALAAHRVLDVGAGDGWFASQLARHLPADAEIVCWDVNYTDAELDEPWVGEDARLRRTRERPARGFDLVLALDVLEHIEHPTQFIANELTAIIDGGTPALVAVPAYQRLFSAHDAALGHHRRYGRRQLLDELSPWLDVTDHGSLFTSLVPARAAGVFVERLRRTPPDRVGIGEWNGGAALTRIVNGALATDARLGFALSRRGVRLPGLSHWAFGGTR